MISTEKKKKINERCKALEKEFERRYKKETEVVTFQGKEKVLCCKRGRVFYCIGAELGKRDRIRTRILKNRSGKKHV